MRRDFSQYRPRPIVKLIGGGAILLLVWGFFPAESFTRDPLLWLLFAAFGLGGAVTAYNGLRDLSEAVRRIELRLRALRPSGAFGRAAFASLYDCQEAGLLEPQGLYLGTQDGRPLFYNGKAHLLTVAPARQGKGIMAVIPNLLHWQGSVFVTDPKGELASVTAGHRREKFGQSVYILNPWGLHGLPQHRYNPLQALIDAGADPEARRGIADEAKALALQLLPEPEGEKNRYFRDGSRRILRALFLHLATRGQPALCTLPECWRILNNRGRLKETIAEMAGSTALDGAVADLGEDLSYLLADNPEQFADFLQGAAQAIDIFDPMGHLAESVSASDFDFATLKEGKASVYLVIPQDRIATHGAWLGLMSRKAIDAVARSAGRSPVLFLLDEFQNMGKLAGLAESLTALPGLGVRVWAFVQELSEVRNLYGRETAETLLSQAEVKQFFAVQNFELCKALSATLGTRTVKTRNYNLGKSLFDEVGESLSETGRPLMSPEDIRQMGGDQQFLLIRDLPPIRATRIPFWAVKPWAAWAGINPVEGTPPQVRPLVSLDYRQDKAAAMPAPAFTVQVKGARRVRKRLPQNYRRYFRIAWFIFRPRAWLWGAIAVAVFLYSTNLPGILLRLGGLDDFLSGLFMTGEQRRLKDLSAPLYEEKIMPAAWWAFAPEYALPAGSQDRYRRTLEDIFTGPVRYEMLNCIYGPLNADGTGFSQYTYWHGVVPPAFPELRAMTSPDRGTMTFWIGEESVEACPEDAARALALRQRVAG